MSDTLALTSALSRGSLLDKIAGGAVPPQFDYLSALGRAQQVGAGAWGLREAQAKQLAGEAYQGAIDSEGNFDPAKFQRNLVAAGPDASLAVGAGVESATRVGGALQDQGMRGNAALVGALTGALKAPPGQLHDAVAAQTAMLINQGVLPQSRALRALSMLPNDEGQLRARLEQMRVALLPPDMQQGQVYGTPQTITGPGGVAQSAVTRPASEGYGVTTPPQPGAQLGIGPDVAGQPIKYIDGSGKEVQTTLGEYMTQRGLGHLVTPQGGQPTGGLPGPQSNPSPANPPRLNPAAQPGPARPQLTTTSGPAPGDVPTQEASARAYTDDLAASGTYNDRVFPLAQAWSLMKDPGVQTGPGTQWFNNVKAFLQARATTFGVNPQEVGAVDKYQELQKYMTQYVNKMGSGSDARLASALSGNPNTHISTLANKDVLSAMIALERYRQAAMLDFRAQGLPPAKWSSFLSDWQTSHDPRAFVVDMLDDAKRTKVLQGMSPSERAAFGRSLDVIEKNGDVMNLPGMH
jgi:hypothetical protein